MRYCSIAALVLAAPGLFGVATAAQAQTSASPAKDETVIQEVVVTAQHRSESVQKAAIPISVINGQALASAGVTNPSELTRLVPALHVSPQANTYEVFNVRGIANFAVTTWADPAVLVNYDGVPIASGAGTVGLFYDMDRMEVVKGPQGTLYGRNATGGAVNILPKRPQLGVLGGDISAEFGNYNLQHVTGALNVPTSANSALRGSFDLINRDGYYSTGTGDDVAQAGRLQFRAEPTSALSIRIAGDYFHQGGRGPGAALVHGQYLPGTHSPLLAAAPPVGIGFAGVPDPQMGQFINPSNPWTDVNDPSVCSVKAAYFGGNQAVCLDDSHVNNQFWGLNATIGYDFGFANLTVIPAYRAQSIAMIAHNNPDLHQFENASQTSVEARLASSHDESARLKWVVGGFWIDNPDHGDFGINLIPAPTTELSGFTHLDTTSWATFAQATYSVLPGARITGGIRYTVDDKTFNVRTVDNPPNDLCGPGSPAGCLVSASQAKKSWNAVTWKVGVEFDVARNSLLYFNVDRGYHSGGFFTSSGTDFSYQPEFVTAFTAGSKNQLFDRRLQVNIEGFHYQYSGQQISHTNVAAYPGGPPPFGLFIIPGFITQNIGYSQIWGIETDAAFKLTSTTLITADLQWEHATYDKFLFSSGVLPMTSGCTALPPTPTGLPAPFNLNDFFSCAGKPMLQTPELKLTFGIQQTVPLANGASLVGGFNAYVQSSQWASGGYIYLPYEHVGTQWSSDLDLTYNAPAGKWSVTAFVHNVTNQANTSMSYGTGDLGGIGPYFGSPPVRYLDPPRTYGMRVAAHF